MATVTRFLGFCACCQQDFKLDERNKLVHHGYLRPGDGHIHGDCEFVGLDPFEVSAEPARKLADRLRADAEAMVKRADALANGEVTYLIQLHRDYDRKVLVRTFSRFVSDAWTFDNVAYQEECDLRYRAKVLGERIDYLDAILGKWTPQPIRTVEEEARKAEASRAQKRAEREEKRAAAAAKKAALEAKRDAALAKKVALIESLVSTAISLAESKRAGGDVEAPVSRLVRDIRRSKLWMHDLKPAHGALADLGLGKMRAYGGFIEFEPSQAILR
jgi:hypothetical protein